MKYLIFSTTRSTPRATAYHTLFIFFLTFMLTSCGFHGRKYTSGHFWEGRNDIEYGYAYPEKNQKQKENEKEEQNLNKKESEKESEKGKGNEIAIKIDSKSIVKDTLKISSLEKNSRKRRELKKEGQGKQDQEIQFDEKQDVDRDEKKLRRAKNGFLTFWVIESLFYLGLLGNAYSPDVWGFWLAIFGILTLLYMIPLLIYMAVMQRRYSRSKNQIKDEILKAKIPKLMRVFAWAILIEVGLLILAFVLGGNI